MCKTCGCGEASRGHKHTHTDDSGKAYEHTHDHEHHHAHGVHEKSRVISLEQKILDRNDKKAAENREWLDQHGVVALNLISSPGAGKTFLLERTLERLKNNIKCAVITGDLKTDNDARRLMNKGAEVAQIETISACHLDAEQIARIMPEVIKPGTQLLFIENVGNLVCPAAFDLGEHFKVALLSSTEGEDKPLKYPTLFTSAPVVIMTKMDLAQHLDWDPAECRKNLRRTHPGVFIFELSAKTGDGMDAWLDYLAKLVK